MLRRIRTSIRSERGALGAFAVVSAGAAAALLLALTFGDQREVRAVVVSPEPGMTVPVTLRQVSITFNVDPDREAVVERLAVEPEAAGTVRWRGRTLEFVFEGPLAPGEHRLTVAAGRLGRGGERLAEAVVVAFTAWEPGLLVVLADADGERLVALRDGQQTERLAAERIRDYAISPDGTRIAVVTEVGGSGQLVLIEGDGEPRVVVGEASVDIGSVSWAADSNAMLVSRRDRLPSGEQSAPRTWLVRVTGEFVSQIDPSGEPSLGAQWSPDAQWIVYAAPATAEARVLNLSTREERVIGQPRSQALAWSPDSRLVAFESVPGEERPGEAPAAPVRVASTDGTVELLLGEQGELRSAPRFLDSETLMTMRRVVSATSPGTELLFEAVPSGQLRRSVLLAPAGDAVLSWDLDPLGARVVYVVQSGNALVVLVLDLESGQREVMPIEGRGPRWLP